ncbi:MAG: septum formation initiator family protein [Balneolaceae bacterium]|nr:septum formation initiator family protein [Balneolaceae bacterium]MBO6545806.1 septum formation initiator family protein [Balneolaceae bacterium]MBO6647202.1 septum formation initiator family protein [Balneolaceae bacterium]
MSSDLFNPLRWNKSFLAMLLTAFVLVWFSFIDVYSLKTRWELNDRKQELELRTEELAVKSEELKEKTELLEKDPALLEKIAREEYGMRKPGETVYKIKPEN